jgi:hypothetical protein
MAQDENLDEDLRLARLRHSSPGEYLLIQLGDENTNRLVRATDNGAPVDVLGVTARWWQLETYLRLLVYIQLRGRFGAEWLPPLTNQPVKRVERAKTTRYMASADDTYPLAHVDVGGLFELILERWEECSHGIGLPADVWRGRTAEIVPIRHRMAHCRRPHADDAVRIEQLLRDLEPAANLALRQYVRWWEPSPELEDPIIDDWVRLRHPVAQRLVEHGARNKGIIFDLMTARLPWADKAERITGTPGWFWVMHVVLRERQIYIDDYWSQQAVQAQLPMAGHIIQSSPWSIAVTVPAVGDPAAISDAIAGFFEAVFRSATQGDGSSVRHPWRRTSLDLDPRVDAAGRLSVLSGLNDDDLMTIFAAY